MNSIGYRCCFILLFLTSNSINTIAQNHIVISKDEFKLTVLNSLNDTLMVADVALGKNFGNKEKEGDYKTPEGTFKITQIKSSSNWSHDFNDGHGNGKGAYGPYFIRIKTPITNTIGIHGTCFPDSMKTRSSEGCIRLQNDDLLELVRLIKVGDECEILPDS